jgi:hypothetical protein
MKPTPVGAKSFFNKLLIKVDEFMIKYRIKHLCIVICKFSNQPIDRLNLPPYIDMPLVDNEDNNANIIEENLIIIYL